MIVFKKYIRKEVNHMNKANVKISWNGVPAATGTTRTEFDNPFVIGRVDLSKLNSLLGNSSDQQFGLGYQELKGLKSSIIM